jgi:hypothetical protein
MNEYRLTIVERMKRGCKKEDKVIKEFLFCNEKEFVDAIEEYRGLCRELELRRQIEEARKRSPRDENEKIEYLVVLERRFPSSITNKNRRLV